MALNHNLQEQLKYLQENLSECHFAGFQYAPTGSTNIEIPAVFNFETQKSTNSKNSSKQTVSDVGFLDLQSFRTEHNGSSNSSEASFIQPVTMTSNRSRYTTSVAAPVVLKKSFNIQDEISRFESAAPDSAFMDIDIDALVAAELAKAENSANNVNIGNDNANMGGNAVNGGVGGTRGTGRGNIVSGNRGNMHSEVDMVVIDDDDEPVSVVRTVSGTVGTSSGIVGTTGGTKTTYNVSTVYSAQNTHYNPTTPHIALTYNAHSTNQSLYSVPNHTTPYSVVSSDRSNLNSAGSSASSTNTNHPAHTTSTNYTNTANTHTTNTNTSHHITSNTSNTSCTNDGTARHAKEAELNQVKQDMRRYVDSYVIFCYFDKQFAIVHIVIIPPLFPTIQILHFFRADR